MTDDRVVSLDAWRAARSAPGASEGDAGLREALDLLGLIRRDLDASGQSGLADLVNHVFYEAYAAGVRYGAESGGVGA